MEHTNHIALAELPANDRARILSFAVGRHAASRFASLGLTPGALVSMIQNYGRGPLIVAVRGARVALGRGEASKIFVERRISE